ncbi:hypothetical protein LOTGIDRAFT_155103 [Lottia gigantea]|uniref:Uncharacterized protein n=1 Tax=Lottia gigantea TaxID=225164 RepID=V3ZSR1_LOTGI|nr:hypothetical protein LOTGIDRAFT_155103 [Lottia gigantea]ESO85615.1 hypothetical protein LOTGIDRAFT_155103 [Lottia gigantea]
MRKDIFTKFWIELQSWDQRRAWVSTLIKIVDIKQKKACSNSRRKYSWTYNLIHRSKSYQVCKSMFVSTLGLQRTLLDWVQDSKPENDKLEIITEEGIANVQKPTRYASNKSKPDDLDFLNNFLSSLSTVESHYCRAACSDKKFLEPGTTFNGIYDEYRKQAGIADSCPLSYPIFHRIFNERRFSVFVPRKDQCDMCVGYKHGNTEQDI